MIENIISLIMNFVVGVSSYKKKLKSANVIYHHEKNIGRRNVYGWNYSG